MIHDGYRPGQMDRGTRRRRSEKNSWPIVTTEAVHDLSLFDLKTGAVVCLGDIDRRSHHSPAVRRSAPAARPAAAAMEAEGFAVYEPEWWHYDYKDWKEYPILNIGFSEVRRQK
jgi:D-alanyl-D-alanine dipeptidase